MQPWYCFLFVGFAIAAVPASAEVRDEAKASVIRDTVAGKMCANSSGLVKFGRSAPGSPGSFERKGRSPATYAIGNGTLLIRREGALHSHLALVSDPHTPDALLYFGGEKFRCLP
jgi:hypothetical protein